MSRGLPFLLRPDGTADPDVLAFFASSTFKLLSDQTQLSYAKDLRFFLSFLESQGISWRDASWSEVLDYEHWRRRDEENPRRISGVKMSRELAACKKFYGWQQRRGVVSTTPFATGEPLAARSNSLRVKDARSNRVKWLTPRAYQQWRDVGLAGRVLTGEENQSWRGRSDGRNCAFADALWASGLRLREAATLLNMELPSVENEAAYHRGRVGHAVAKGRGRDFWISARATRQLAAYAVSSRAAAVSRAQHEGRYDAIPDRIVLREHTGRRLIVTHAESGRTQETSLDLLTAGQRSRLYSETPRGLEPAMVFLGESGLPMQYSSWEATFASANRRCAENGVSVTCHPHMLRHSFALRMLVTLMHAFDQRMGLSPEERRDYRMLFGDPWTLVQTLLGHSSPQITRDVYLEPVKGLHVDLFLNEKQAQDDAAFTAAVGRHLAATGLVNDGVDA